MTETSTKSTKKSSGSGNAYSGDWSVNLCPANKYSLKCPNTMKPVGICMHNTANNAPAKNEINYMNNNSSSTSFHLAVDENEAIQGLPFDRNGWHAGDGNGPGNRKHIGIEIARSTDNTPGVFEKAERRAACVVAKLCNLYGWGVGQVKAHRDFAAKDCPHRTSMDAFRNMVSLALEGKLTESTSTTAAPATGSGKTSGASVKVGDKVKVTGTNYATGQTIPAWVKKNTYTVTKVSGDRALLSDIISWVYMSDLAVQGATKTETPKTDSPKTETSKTDSPKTETAKTDSSKQSAEEKAQYDASVTKLASYTGGKLAPNDFLALFGPVAREDNRSSRVPASVTLAQAALETGWGKSTIGQAKNLFGIKGTGPAGSVTSPTQEYENGKFVTINGTFRAYNTWLESVQDHGTFLQKDRYKNAFNYCDDPDQFAREIHKAGYATDPDYSKKLIQLMSSYNMYQYNVSGAKKAETGSTNTTSSTTAPSGASKPSASTGSASALDALLNSHPEVKTNQHLINLFYKLGGNTFDGAAAKASQYGVDINALVANRSGAVARPGSTSGSSTSSASSASTSSAGSASALDALLNSHPEVKTNQHLINLFYKLGGNTFDGAAAKASQYGVDINALVANRSGTVARSGSTSGSSTSSASSASTSSASVGVGSKVRITGSNYATGQAIPNWVKQNTYTVKQISGDRALIAEIVSWVYTKDLQLISGGVANTSQSQSQSQSESQSQSTSGGGSIGVGSQVRITGANYATGQAVPAWVKNNTYTVQQMNGSKALLSGIISWVYTKDLQLVSGGVSGSSNASNNAESDATLGKTQSSGKATAHVNFGTKNSNPRNNSIRKITIHHMAGNMGAVSCANMHKNGSGASANYYIGSDGTICSGVAENRRAWTSSSGTNDHQAITYEVANNSGAPNWTISQAAYDAMIALSRDICSRYGINPYYDGTSGASLTTHDMFASTVCPGPYIKGKLKNGQIEKDMKGA